MTARTRGLALRPAVTRALTCSTNASVKPLGSYDTQDPMPCPFQPDPINFPQRLQNSWREARVLQLTPGPDPCQKGMEPMADRYTESIPRACPVRCIRMRVQSSASDCGAMSSVTRAP